MLISTWYEPFLLRTPFYQFSPMSYPVSLHQQSCLLANFILQQDVIFGPVLTQWPSSPTLSPVLVQSQVVSPSVVVGYANPVGCILPHLPSLVSQTECHDRCSVTSSGTRLFFFTVTFLTGWSASWIDHQISGLSQLQNHIISTGSNWTPYDLRYFIGDFSSAVILWTSIEKTVKQ